MSCSGSLWLSLYPLYSSFLSVCLPHTVKTIKQQETVTRSFDCIWHWVFSWSPSKDSAKSDLLEAKFGNPYWVLIFLIPWAILDIFMSLQRIFTKRAIAGFLRTIRGCFLFLFSFACVWWCGCNWLVRAIWEGVLLSLLCFPFMWSGAFNWQGRYCKKKSNSANGYVAFYWVYHHCTGLEGTKCSYFQGHITFSYQHFLILFSTKIVWLLYRW